MVMLNTADAGVSHARTELTARNPTTSWNHDNRFHDRGEDTGAYFVTQVSGDAIFGGASYTHNLGVYEVSATFERCGPPPSGYSTELGSQHFRSDYWRVESTATTTDLGFVPINANTAMVVSIIRKATEGDCKMN